MSSRAAVVVDPVEAFFSDKKGAKKGLSPQMGGEIFQTPRNMLFNRLVKEYGPVANNIKSYNHFIRTIMPLQIRMKPMVDENGRMYVFFHARVSKPMLVSSEAGKESLPLFPYRARKSGLTYAGNLYADLYAKISEAEQRVAKRETVVASSNKGDFPPLFIEDGTDVYKLVARSLQLGGVPIMTGSDWCHLNGYTADELAAVYEDADDPQGYFIIKGNERMLVCQEKLCTAQQLTVEQEKGVPATRVTIPNINGTTVLIVTLGKTWPTLKFTLCQSGMKSSVSRKFPIFVLFDVMLQRISPNLYGYERTPGKMSEKIPEEVAENREEILKRREKIVQKSIEMMMLFIASEYHDRARLFLAASLAKYKSILEPTAHIVKKRTKSTTIQAAAAQAAASAPKRKSEALAAARKTPSLQQQQQTSATSPPTFVPQPRDASRGGKTTTKVLKPALLVERRRKYVPSRLERVQMRLRADRDAFVRAVADKIFYSFPSATSAAILSETNSASIALARQVVDGVIGSAELFSSSGSSRQEENAIQKIVKLNTFDVLSQGRPPSSAAGGGPLFEERVLDRVIEAAVVAVTAAVAKAAEKEEEVSAQAAENRGGGMEEDEDGENDATFSPSSSSSSEQEEEGSLRRFPRPPTSPSVSATTRRVEQQRAASPPIAAERVSSPYRLFRESDTGVDNIVDEILNDMFVNVSLLTLKPLHLARLVAQQILACIGVRAADNRDGWENKRIEVPAGSLSQLFSGIFRGNISARGIYTSEINLLDEFISSFGPKAAWGGRENISDMVKRDTPLALISQISRINTPASRQSKQILMRMVQPSQAGFCCIGETPEGQACGLTKSASCTMWNSIRRDAMEYVEAVLEPIVLQETGLSLAASNHDAALRPHPILVNNTIVGWCDAPSLDRPLRSATKRNLNFFDVSVSMCPTDRTLEIFTTGSRPTRPLFTVDEEAGGLVVDMLEMSNSFVDSSHKRKLRRRASSSSESSLSYRREGNAFEADVAVEELIEAGAIQFISAREQRLFRIIEFPHEVSTVIRDRQAKRKEEEGVSANEGGKNLFLELACEIDPVSIFGVSAALMPVANTNQGPRITYQAGMAKQSLGHYHDSYYARFDTSFKRFDQPSRPSFDTRIAEPFGLNRCPTGRMFLLAFYALANNIEDGIVLQKESVEALTVTKYSTHKVVVRNPAMPSATLLSSLKSRAAGSAAAAEGGGSLLAEQPPPPPQTHGSGVSSKLDLSSQGNGATTTLAAAAAALVVGVPVETIERPDEAMGATAADGGSKRNVYSLIFRSIGPDGLPIVGTRIIKGSCIVGKVRTILGTNGSITRTNTSVYAGVGDEGIVDRVEVTQSKDSAIVRVRIRQIRGILPGDKMASRYSQKGTIGAFRSRLGGSGTPNFAVRPTSAEQMDASLSGSGGIRLSRDLPRIATGPNKGVIPDIWINPAAMPTRMTIGKMYELITSKASLVTGERFDATTFGVFGRDAVDYSRSKLLAAGMDQDGYEEMEHADGTPIRGVKVFVAPCYYQVLRHHVLDKIQYRARGSIVQLTLQPVHGRSVEGGLRQGEMERAALLSWGASDLVRERLMLASDKYRLEICATCGNHALVNPRLAEKLCQMCRDPRVEKIGTVTCSFVSLLITKILQGMGITMTYGLRPADPSLDV